MHFHIAMALASAEFPQSASANEHSFKLLSWWLTTPTAERNLVRTHQRCKCTTRILTLCDYALFVSIRCLRLGTIKLKSNFDASLPAQVTWCVCVCVCLSLCICVCVGLWKRREQAGGGSQVKCSSGYSKTSLLYTRLPRVWAAHGPGQPHKMSSLWCLEFLLCLQLLHRADSEEPDHLFRVQGSTLEMGYCFGVDYIVVYKSTPGGEKLLGNSSDNSTAVTPPDELLDRVRLNHQDQLLGLQIFNLTHMDSGIYRKECWQNQNPVSQITRQLSVCDEEVESKEITVKEGAAGVELLCNSTSTGLEGTSVRWYHTMYPTYKNTLFLDSGVSLEPLWEEMKGHVEVRDQGASLVIDKNLLKSSNNFQCLVIKGKRCLSVHEMFLDQIESRDIFVSHGDRVVLKCPSDGKNQQWHTPLGEVNSSSTRNSEVYLSAGDRSKDFSLVIPAVTDQHVGDFFCISTSFELRFLLKLCPREKPQEKMDFGGRNFSLECKVSLGDSQKVLWYRTETSGEYKLILDSDDTTAPSLEDLEGRVTLSDNGSSLIISSVQMNDAGVYWCVVLEGAKFLDDDGFTYDYEGEYTDDDEYGEANFSQRCILKQETVLTLIKPVTPNPKNRNRGANPTADPPPASNVTAYAAGAGVVALLVVGAIAAYVVIRKKMAKSRSGINKEREIKMTEDPGCTRSLTGDECDA